MEIKNVELEKETLKIGATYSVDTYECGKITGKLIKLTSRVIILDDGKRTHQILY